MKRNITILYTLAFFGNAWIWMAIWSLYYLMFTDYTGIGVLEMVTYVTVLLVEIPSGALADLLGRKRVLTLGYLLFGVGNIVMGLATGFPILLAAVFLCALGVAFLSGSFEAITYDSLLSSGKEDEYETVNARQGSIRLFTHAIGAFAGGFVFVFDPHAPFFMTGAFMFAAMFLALFLREPTRHLTHFSWKNLWQQNRQGFHELFLNKGLLPYSLMFLLVSAVPIMMYEYAAELTLVEKGATAEQMGFFLTTILIFAAVMTYLTPAIVRIFGRLNAYLLFAGVYALFLLLVPAVSLWMVFIFNIFWAGATTVRNIVESKIINMHITSEARATTLSTLSMLKYLPHAASVIFLGALADKITLAETVFYMGVAMVVCMVVAVVQYRILK